MLYILLAQPTVAAAVAVDDEDGVHWWRGGAFNGGGSIRQRRRWGLRIGDDKATMEIDISGGGWQCRASAFDSGAGRRWVLAFDGGDGRQLWQRWTIETAFNGGGGGGVRWWRQHSTAFDGVGDDYDERTRGQRKSRQCNNQPAR